MKYLFVDDPVFNKSDRVCVCIIDEESGWIYDDSVMDMMPEALRPFVEEPVEGYLHVKVPRSHSYPYRRKVYTRFLLAIYGS